MGRRYLDIEELREHRRLEECEEVMLVERWIRREASWRKLQNVQELSRDTSQLVPV